VRLDLDAAERWIREHVRATGPVETVHERPWSTVLRVPVAGGAVWFKACAPVQAFEPRLSFALASRWPDRVAGVVACDADRKWLLLADAGAPVAALGDRVDVWPRILPLYAELQRGEIAHAGEHLEHGVPDLRPPTLPARLGELLARTDLPLEAAELARLRALAARFDRLCSELASRGPPPTIQHDDLHYANVYAHDGSLRVLDWGDACVSHPFASLVVTFRFLEESDGLDPRDAVFARVRDAYLEPWGPGHEETFELALRVGSIAHAIAWLRQRDHLAGDDRVRFDHWFAVVLRRALARTDAPA
jgi:hypothetical protein